MAEAGGATGCAAVNHREPGRIGPVHWCPKEKLLPCFYIMDEFCSIRRDAQTPAKEEGRL